MSLPGAVDVGNGPGNVDFAVRHGREEIRGIGHAGLEAPVERNPVGVQRDENTHPDRHPAEETEQPRWLTLDNTSE